MSYSKEELFDLIINSPSEFNEWKKSQTDEVDLSEMDFSSQTLENVDFENADLNGSSFADFPGSASVITSTNNKGYLFC